MMVFNAFPILRISDREFLLFLGEKQLHHSGSGSISEIRYDFQIGKFFAFFHGSAGGMGKFISKPGEAVIVLR